MSTEQAFRDHEMRLMNPPDNEVLSEPCDRCHKDIGSDSATLVRMSGGLTGYYGYFCADCATPVDRCDKCHFIRCNCDE